MPIVSMSLDAGTLRKFEETVRRRGYPSRSEAFREALRDFIDEAEWAREGGANTLILAAIVEKETRSDLVAIQHRFAEIRTMLHTHLDEANCLEIFVAEGPSGRLKDFVQALRRVRGVRATKFISTTRNL